MHNTDDDLKNLKPENFWPEAEELLDRHYRLKRRRRFLLVSLAAALLCFTGWQLLHNANVGSSESAMVTPQPANEVSGSGATITAPVTNETASPAQVLDEVKPATSITKKTEFVNKSSTPTLP